jgi:hypothetical protein
VCTDTAQKQITVYIWRSFYEKEFSRSSLALLFIPFLFSTSVSAAANDDQPTVVKDTVQVTAFTYNVYKGNYDNWSWVPLIKYRVTGPIPSGSQLYVEFSLPTGPWVKFDCSTDETSAGRWYETECGGRDGVPEDKSSTFTGLVTFTIKLRNELAGTNATLFTGKAKVEKAHSNDVGPKAVNRWVYFVNHDWNLPIGYVFLTPDSLKGWDWPNFHVALFPFRSSVIKMEFGTRTRGRMRFTATRWLVSRRYLDQGKDTTKKSNSEGVASR